MESKFSDILTILFMLLVLSFGLVFLLYPQKVFEFYNKYENSNRLEQYMQKITTPLMYKFVAIAIICFSLILIVLLIMKIFKSY